MADAPSIGADAPYIGEIRMFAGSFAPYGWNWCDGTLLQIADWEMLFDLIGTTYGGDGQTTFALPDLRGRIPVHQGNGFTPGQTGGVEEVTLTVDELPAHSHPLAASTNLGTANSPIGSVVAQSPSIKLYRTSAPSAALAPNADESIGGGQSHTNIQPVLAVGFIISLHGYYPPT